MKKAKRPLVIRLAGILTCAVLAFGFGMNDAYAASSNGVIEGKDGFYFVTHDSTIQDYEGTNLYSEDVLNVIKSNYLIMRDTLAANGIDFIVYLIPNKENIYSEYMPDSYGERAPYTRIQQVYDLLKDDIHVIYPEEMLIEAKDEYQYTTYYKTDPHWNGIGTYLGAKLLMEELGYEMPELEDVTILTYEQDDLTCAELLGKKIPEESYYVTGYEDQEPLEQRIFICGDSFGLQLSDYISPIVEDCFMIHRDLYEPYMPVLQGSTVLVLEVLERFMDVIPIFTCV